MSSSTRIPKLLPSQKGHLYFLEHARLEVEDGCTVFKSAENGRYVSYNLTCANTSLVMLGEGTSVTRDAVRLCAEQGLMLVFTGGGGSPFLSGTDDVCFPLSPGGEYQPTEYMQRMAKIFFDTDRRLAMAKALLRMRYANIEKFWLEIPAAKNLELALDYADFLKGRTGRQVLSCLESASTTADLLSAEAEMSKNLYALVAKAHQIQSFRREPHSDAINQRLDHGNSLIYGLAALSLHTLGISYAFPVLHGRTTRGGLVFDIADLLKDALVLPLAFAHNSEPHPVFREHLVALIHQKKVIALLMSQIKELLAC